MLTSFTRDEKKILLFIAALVGGSSAILFVGEQQNAQPIFRGQALHEAKSSAPGGRDVSDRRDLRDLRDLRDARDTGTTAAAGLTRSLGVDGKIDLNAASTEVLQSVPGIGPSVADAIIAHGSATGGFRTVEDLADVRGIGPATLAKIRPYVSVQVIVPRSDAPLAGAQAPAPAGGQPTMGPVPAAPAPGSMASPPSAGPLAMAPSQLAPSMPQTAPQQVQPRVAAPSAPVATGPININTATAEQLETLHKVGPVLARKIIEHRQTHGPFHSVTDLDAVKGIGPKILDMNRNRITVY